MKTKKQILIFTLFLGLALAGFAQAKVALSPDGTIYLIEQNQRRGFPSASVFFSHGYSFSDAVSATPSELALPAGPIITYAEGSLVKGSEPVVFIISDGLRRPFTSAEVFLGLGYAFANVLLDEGGRLANFSVGDAVNSQSAAHPAGTLVNDQGTVYLVTLQGKKGIPSVEVFSSYLFRFKNVVPANSADKGLADQGNLPLKQEQPGIAKPPAEEEAPKPEEPVTAPGNQAPSAPAISGAIGTFPVTNETFKITSTDPQNDNITYTVDWGDGSTKVVLTLASGSTLTTSHGWTYIGEYTITVIAADDKGHSASSTHLVKVNSDTSIFGPAVTVLSPNGGEKYTAAQAVKITWRRNWMPQQAFGKTDIYYRRGGFNTLIKADALDAKGYDWVPTGIVPAGDDYKIVVISQGNPGGGSVVTSDESDGFFSITSVLGATKPAPQPSSGY